MRLKTLFCFGAASVAFTSCVQKAYFTSPSYGNAMPYHTLPLRKDSTKNNLYLNASVFDGTANYNNSDEQLGLDANLYNANTFSNFKIWYGAGVTAGIYNVNKMDGSYYDTSSYINTNAGNKFYGSVNGNAGVAYALQLGNVEWRIVGIQATAQQEFGNYLNFRKELNKLNVTVDGNVTDAFLLTTGISSEICIPIPNGSFNIAQQYNVLTGKHNRYLIDDYENDMDVTKLKRYDYFTSTYSVTLKNMTYFLQTNLQPPWKLNDDGPQMQNVHVGINYKLPARKRYN